jgi:hypothetical protein
MSIAANVIGWLRAGYPNGVPEVDYVPLFALLGSHLTDDEVEAIATELGNDGQPSTAGHIHAAINAMTSQPPLDVDIARVRARLAAGGWPLADVRSLAQNLQSANEAADAGTRCGARCDDLATPRTLGPFRDLVGSVGTELSQAVTDGHDRDRLLTALRCSPRRGCSPRPNRSRRRSPTRYWRGSPG